MFKVLIIDDDIKRSERIEKALLELKIPINDITPAYSIIEGKEKLEETNFDAVIIDIVLPQRVGDKKKVDDGGIKLLKNIKRKKKGKLPSRVIGITSNLSQHQAYQIEFNKLCELVIPVEHGSCVWLETIIEDIKYRISDKITSNSIEAEYALVTIHGIRTFGEWQERLYNIVSNEIEGVTKLNFDYGYLDLISFLIPPLRDRPINRLYNELIAWSQVHSAKKFYFVAHSFGTYILAQALRKLIASNAPFQIQGVVLCGSVIKSKQNWEKIRGNRNFFVVNECGTHDFILWLSNVFAPKLGMAGKVGFSWINTGLQSNRFHSGGHSLYFETDGKPDNNFMKQNWLPLFSDKVNLQHVDERKYNIIHHGVIEVGIKLLGVIFYPLIIILFLSYVIKLLL